MENLELNKIDEVYFQVKNLTRSSALEIKEYFSCYIENRWFNPRVKAKIWDGKISFFDWNNQTIPIGLFPQFVKFCNKFGYQYKANFNRSEFINEISDEEFETFYEAIFTDSSYSPRDYQDYCIKKALRMKRGVIESPTGSGKSLVIYSIIRFILGIAHGKILLIVPNVSLVNQMKSDFKDYNWKNIDNFLVPLYHNSNFRENEEYHLSLENGKKLVLLGNQFIKTINNSKKLVSQLQEGDEIDYVWVQSNYRKQIF